MKPKRKKSLVGWYVYDKECSVVYWDESEWQDPYQKCKELATNIFSQKKMAKRVRENKEKIVKVRITIEEI